MGFGATCINKDILKKFMSTNYRKYSIQFSGISYMEFMTFFVEQKFTIFILIFFLCNGPCFSWPLIGSLLVLFIQN